MKLKTVGRFLSSEEAHLARIQLELNNIDAVIFDEYHVQMDWLIANAIGGGMRLQVVEAEEAKANQVLAEWSKNRNRDITESAEPCPNCGHTTAKIDHKPSLLVFISILLLNFPLVCFGRQYCCPNCKKTRSSLNNRMGFAFEFLGGSIMAIGSLLVIAWILPIILDNVPTDSPLYNYQSEKFPTIMTLLPGTILFTTGWFIIGRSARKKNQG